MKMPIKHKTRTKHRIPKFNRYTFFMSKTKYLFAVIAIVASILGSKFFDDTTPNVSNSNHSVAFKNQKYLYNHFKKHGIEMGYSSAAAYVKRANEVIHADTVLLRTQDDSDTAYFLPATGEFVVVSYDGYIRTFFIPEDGIKYFYKQ